MPIILSTEPGLPRLPGTVIRYRQEDDPLGPAEIAELRRIMRESSAGLRWRWKTPERLGRVNGPVLQALKTFHGEPTPPSLLDLIVRMKERRLLEEEGGELYLRRGQTRFRVTKKGLRDALTALVEFGGTISAV